MEADGTIAKIASKYDSYGVPGSLIKTTTQQPTPQTRKAYLKCY